MINNNPGLNCPKCGFKIQVSIKQLLTKQGIVCPVCGLKLNIDDQKSKNALDALKDFDDKMKQIKK